jgi:hypothetical protein
MNNKTTTSAVNEQVCKSKLTGGMAQAAKKILVNPNRRSELSLAEQTLVLLECDWDVTAKANDLRVLISKLLVHATKTDLAGTIGEPDLGDTLLRLIDFFRMIEDSEQVYAELLSAMDDSVAMDLGDAMRLRYIADLEKRNQVIDFTNSIKTA